MAFFSRKKRVDTHTNSRRQSRTVQPELMSDSKLGRLLSYQVSNLQGIGTCQQQEDAFGFVNVTDVTEIRKKGFMAIMADGMGGMRDGKFAGETAVSVLRSVFDRLNYEEDLADQLNNGMLEASDSIFNALGGQGGSTAVACLFYNGELYYSSIGDSYLMIKRDNQLFRLNRPHNVLHEKYYEEIKSGSTDTESANSDERKAGVTQFLGMEEITDIDFLPRALRLHDGDVIMACSDGVAGVLTEECMLSCLSSPSTDEMCALLQKSILEQNRSYQDNFTALVIKCEY